MIHRYDIDADAWRHHVPIVRQAQEGNLYGQLETTLSRIESWAAPPIRKIVDDGQLPENLPAGTLTDRAKVALFLASTYCRNISEADFQNEVYAAMIKQEARTRYHEELRQKGIDLDDYNIAVAPRGSLAMRNIGGVAECLDGMGIYLLFSDVGGFSCRGQSLHHLQQVVFQMPGTPASCSGRNWHLLVRTAVAASRDLAVRSLGV